MKRISMILALVMILSVIAGCAPSGPANNVNVSPANSTANAGDGSNTVQPDNAANAATPDNSAGNTNTAPPSNTGANTNTVPPANTSANTNTVPPANSAENTNTVPPTNTAENTNTVPSGNTAGNISRPPKVDNTNTVPAAAASFAEPYISGIFTEESLMQYLEGEWDMLPSGALPQYPDDECLKLKVDAKEKSFTFTLAEDSTYIKLGLESIGKIFDFNESLDYIYMSVTECSDKYKNFSSTFVRSPAEFQVLTANAWGFDFLAVRESGSGESGLAYYMLDANKKSIDGFWVFRRVQNSKKIDLTDAQNDDLLIKNGDFYAMSWLCFDNMYYLQQVDVINDYDTFVETPVSVLKNVYYFGNGQTLVAPCYKVAGAKPSEKPGQVKPMLVRVRTNAQGEITEMEGMQYIMYCEYENAYVNDNWYRPALLYSKCDSIYLGDWKIANDSSSTMKIVAASPEVGGYHIAFYLKGIGQMECDAYYMGDDLHLMNNQLIADGKIINGLLQPGEFGTIVMQVSDSEHSALPAGTNLVFKR